MRLIRVFPRRTRATPSDELAYFGPPDLLADAGCDTRDIMAVTGHRTESVVAIYTREADRKKRAAGAVSRLEKAQTRNANCKTRPKKV